MKEEWIDYYVYLEELRRSGRTNMWGAGEFLQVEMGMSRDLAKDVLLNWMKHYEEIEAHLEANNLIPPRED